MTTMFWKQLAERLPRCPAPLRLVVDGSPLQVSGPGQVGAWLALGRLVDLARSLGAVVEPLAVTPEPLFDEVLVTRDATLPIAVTLRPPDGGRVRTCEAHVGDRLTRAHGDSADQAIVQALRLVGAALLEVPSLREPASPWSAWATAWDHASWADLVRLPAARRGEGHADRWTVRALGSPDREVGVFVGRPVVTEAGAVCVFDVDGFTGGPRAVGGPDQRSALVAGGSGGASPALVTRRGGPADDGPRRATAPGGRCSRGRGVRRGRPGPAGGGARRPMVALREDRGQPAPLGSRPRSAGHLVERARCACLTGSRSRPR